MSMKDLLLARAFGGKGGSGGGGGGSGGSDELGYAYGTITPVDNIFEIEHGLGQKPYIFGWFIDCATMTGQVLTDYIGVNENTFDSYDWDHRNHIHRPMMILFGGFLYSYTCASYSDWGYFTKANTEELSDGYQLFCDETKFFSKLRGDVYSIIPYSRLGNVTLHWFAIGG